MMFFEADSISPLALDMISLAVNFHDTNSFIVSTLGF